MRGGKGGEGREGRGRRGLTGSLWPTQCPLETQVEGAELGPKSPIYPVKNSAFSREGWGRGGKGRREGEGRTGVNGFTFAHPVSFGNPGRRCRTCMATFLCRRLWKFDSYS